MKCLRFIALVMFCLWFVLSCGAQRSAKDYRSGGKPIVQCYDDPAGEQRARVETALVAPGLTEWRSEVGLTTDPSQLKLVTDDLLCQQIWDGIGWGQEPIAGYAVTFFKLGDRYVVADYAIYDEQTIVVDENFKHVNPILAD